MTQLAKKFYSKYIISPLDTTLSIRKQKMMMFKAIQRQKLKAELESISKFFKDVEAATERSYSSDSSDSTINSNL